MALNFKEIYKFLLILLLLAIAIIMIGKATAHAQANYLKIKEKDVPITFYWDYYTDTNDVESFNLHRSTTKGIHDPNNVYFTITDPNARQMTISPINEEGSYFFTATAEEGDGDKSDPSNETELKIDFPPKSPFGLGCVPGI